MTLPDTNQNYWQLFSIQGTALGIPALVIGGILTESYGPGTALLSIVVGTLILWVIGLAMISMTYNRKDHALQNIQGHLGSIATWFSMFVLLTAFLIWFTFQIKGATSVVDTLFLNNSSWTKEWSLKVGAFSGCIISLIAMGGIRIIRKICVWIFPFLLFYLISAFFYFDLPYPTFKNTWGLSFYGIVTTMALTLPGYINLPTFFRHARSKQDAFLALTLMVVFAILFQISTIWFRIDNISILISKNTGLTSWSFELVLFLVFVTFSILCINLINIYLSSAVIEMLHPKSDIDSKTYTLLGLAGTLLFGIVQIEFIIKFIESLTECYISVLGISLLQAYLTEIIVKHRPRTNEKIVNSLCFFAGCAASTFVLLNFDEPRAIMAGVGTSVFAFIFIIFCEETYWSFKKILSQRNANISG